MTEDKETDKKRSDKQTASVNAYIYLSHAVALSHFFSVVLSICSSFPLWNILLIVHILSCYMDCMNKDS